MTLEARITALVTAIRTKINLMVPRLIPSGGIAGQLFTKTSGTDYAAGWGNRISIQTGTTNASGLKAVTFSPAFTNVPYVEGQINQASTANPVRMTSVEILDLTVNGCTVKTMRHAVTGVLIGGSVPGAEAYPSVAFTLRAEGL